MTHDFPKESDPKNPITVVRNYEDVLTFQKEQTPILVPVIGWDSTLNGVEVAVGPYTGFIPEEELSLHSNALNWDRRRIEQANEPIRLYALITQIESNKILLSRKKVQENFYNEIIKVPFRNTTFNALPIRCLCNALIVELGYGYTEFLRDVSFSFEPLNTKEEVQNYLSEFDLSDNLPVCIIGISKDSYLLFLSHLLTFHYNLFHTGQIVEGTIKKWVDPMIKDALWIQLPRYCWGIFKVKTLKSSVQYNATYQFRVTESYCKGNQRNQYRVELVS